MQTLRRETCIPQVDQLHAKPHETKTKKRLWNNSVETNSLAALPLKARGAAVTPQEVST